MFEPSIAWQRLRDGNREFSAMLGSQPTPATRGQAPLAAVFRCSDDKMTSDLVFGQSRGTFIDVSTWGHVIDAGVLATIEYAVDTLEVPLIVVLGHAHCAAMQTALNSWNNVDIPDGATRAVVENAMSSLAQRGAGACRVEELTRIHMAHIGTSLLAKSPALARAVDRGQTAIISVVSDSADGHIRTCGIVGDITERERDTYLLEVV
ncbi:carbonic anhydrase [Mycobacterium szulgai]|nr:carbonic anhydrase [Mycobacterium szulgai]